MDQLFNCKNVTYIGTLTDEKYGSIPLFEIQEPTQKEWNRMARVQAKKHKKAVSKLDTGEEE